MGNWEKQQENIRERKEHDKTRKEVLSKFFFNLAQLTFAGLVVGSFTCFLNHEVAMNIYNLIIGCVVTTVFGSIGYLILK